MPELPEVETIRLGLQKYLVGHMIQEVDIRLPKMFSGDSKNVVGAKVVAARRFGKGLLIDLSNGYSIAVHVKMTGQLVYRRRVPRVPQVPRGLKDNFVDLPDKYTHVVFHLDNGSVLYYRDMRQFGWVRVVRTEDAGTLPFFQTLGLEPLKDLTEKAFGTLLKKYKTPIKILLMDQTKIAGIGNIYANDALYRAGIHPKRPGNSLSPKEATAIFAAIEEVLKKGITAGGASEWHYVDVLGGKGQYQKFFLVYGKDGKACKRCGATIERTTMGGRGTFYCPKCQR